MASSVVLSSCPHHAPLASSPPAGRTQTNEFKQQGPGERYRSETAASGERIGSAQAGIEGGVVVEGEPGRGEDVVDDPIGIHVPAGQNAGVEAAGSTELEHRVILEG